MAVERLTDYTRRIWTALDADAPEGHDFQVNDVIYYMDSSQCGIVTYVYPEGSIDVEFLPDIGGGGGGEYTAADFGDMTKPVGEVVYDGAYFGIQNDTSAPAYFAYRSEITKLTCPNYNTTANITDIFRGMTKLQYLIIPKCARLYTQSCANNPQMLAVDCKASYLGSLCFMNSTRMAVLVVRSTSVASLNSTNAFNGSPFASGHSGGTLYVPQALIETYQNATNWATILAYTNNQIMPIEGSIYETQYADGTPIP